MTIYELFNTIKENKSVKQRKLLLEQNMSEAIRYIFNDTYGSKKYGITSFEPLDECGDLTIDSNYADFHSVLNKLHHKEVEGEEAYKLLQETVAKYDKSSQEILCKIIERNLKIGLSYDSFLNVVGVNDATFKIAKFNEVASVDDVDTDGSYFIMDEEYGVRCICKTMRTDKLFTVAFYAENGDLINTLSNLEESINTLTKPLGCGRFILDGIIQLDSKSEGEDLQMEIENAVIGDGAIENPTYVIFDVMTNAQFEMREESYNLEYRLGNLKNLLGFVKLNNIKIANHTKIDSAEILDDWSKHPDGCKCSGCLIRKNDVYKNNTRKDLLVFKHKK